MKSTNNRDLFSTKVPRRPAKRISLVVFTVCYLAAVAPPLYFLYKNYIMLDDIGYKFFPSLLDINNQDRLLILVACLSSYLIGALITLYWQSGFLKQFYKPLEHLQRHMSQTIQGNFSQAPLTQTHENHGDELIKTYNYLYSSIQSNLKRDIIFLQELENVHSPELARVLINEKMEQLSLSEQVTPSQSIREEKQKFKSAN